MALIIEDGTGVLNADSYVSASRAQAFASSLGLAWPENVTAAEQALRRATRFIDASYRGRFLGVRVKGRAQALEWPRSGVFVAQVSRDEAAGDPLGLDDTWAARDGRTYGYGYGYGYGIPAYVLLPNNIVPVEVIEATIEVAIREAGKLTVSVDAAEPNGAVKRVSVGDTSTEFYQPTAAEYKNAGEMNVSLDEVLKNVLSPSRPYTSHAARC
jgi:hypothetical protein